MDIFAVDAWRSAHWSMAATLFAGLRQVCVQRTANICGFHAAFKQCYVALILSNDQHGKVLMRMFRVVLATLQLADHLR